MLASSLAGCASVSQDVDAYYRQMAFNYKEAEEKAKMDAVTLENETKVLATTGDFSKLKAAQRRLNRVKDWEEKCEKEAKRFEKAAEWTEAHFHLEKPQIPDKPPGYHADRRHGGHAGIGGQGSLTQPVVTIECETLPRRARAGSADNLTMLQWVFGQVARRFPSKAVEQRLRPPHPCPAPSL